MEKEFDINRNLTRIYMILIAAACFLPFSVGILPFALILLFTPVWGLGLLFGIPWLIGLLCAAVYILLIPLMADALHYRLDNGTLKVDRGIIFKSRKSIPLEKITDVALVQGPLLWVLGMWSLRIQTAGTGSEMPEATLVGCISPTQVRDEVLAARDEYVKGLAFK